MCWMWRVLVFPVLLQWNRGSLLSILTPFICHWNWRSSPVASTLKLVFVPVAIDWVSGCLVMLGGSTEWKEIRRKHVSHPFCEVKLYTNRKICFNWRLSILFNWILYQASVVTFVTFLNTANTKRASVFGLADFELTVIVNNISLTFLPLELKIISCGFNSEGYICSSSYWLVLGMLSDLGGISW